MYSSENRLKCITGNLCSINRRNKPLMVCSTAGPKRNIALEIDNGLVRPTSQQIIKKAREEAATM
jgi:hypothetical protein